MSYFIFIIHFNIIIPSTRVSPVLPLPFRFMLQNFVRILYPPYAYYMSCQFHPPCCDHHNGSMFGEGHNLQNHSLCNGSYNSWPGRKLVQCYNSATALSTLLLQPKHADTVSLEARSTGLCVRWQVIILTGSYTRTFRR
jgi:hypothetical protein